MKRIVWGVVAVSAVVAACGEPDSTQQMTTPSLQPAGSVEASIQQPGTKALPACSGLFARTAVTRIYRGLLWRDPDEGGLESYAGIISAEKYPGLRRVL